jgi:hypothetical protein
MPPSFTGSWREARKACLMQRTTTLRLVLMCLLWLLVSTRDSLAQDTVQAETAATEWLAHVDAGRYGDSWTSAATSFKQAVTQEKWQAAVKQVRDQVGTLKTRTKASTVPTTNRRAPLPASTW